LFNFLQNMKYVDAGRAVCTFQAAGHKIDPNAVSTRWVREEQAAELVRQARHDAGRGP